MNTAAPLSRVHHSIQITPIQLEHRAGWEPLWRGYLDFYHKPIAAPMIERTWECLLRGDSILGLAATDDRHDVVGIVHFFFHPSTHAVGGNCYLQDLYVAPALRGGGVGHRLILAVLDAAREKGAAVLYWQTEEFNGPARRLYEKVAKRSPFIRYQIDL